MKSLKSITLPIATICGLLLGVLLFTGCETQPVFEEFPTTNKPAAVNANPTHNATAYKPPVGPTDILFIGDAITITLNYGDNEMPTPIQDNIKDDGRITLPIIGAIVAKGKSTGELQDEIQRLYNKYYKHATVTVTARDRYYSVMGEVKNPGTKPYLGKTDLLQAITAASDFTDFANRRKVQVNHANGKSETLDAIRAITEPQQNVPIYPGDTIIIPRRYF